MTKKPKLITQGSKHPKLRDREAYDKQLDEVQNQLLALQQSFISQRERGIILLEGWDCAGKGGIIRRLTTKLDPRAFQVWPIGVPTAVEKGEHYLQRFWRRLPEPGSIAIFDRSWYGRVLVEAVERLASPGAVDRAYDEINQFEEMLLADGVKLVKLFIHITREEQLQRFKGRLTVPYKRWKLTFDDLRNHEKWDLYIPYIEAMFERTSPKGARWHVINANYKWHGRVEALSLIADRLGRGVDLTPPGIQQTLAEEIDTLITKET